MCGILGIVAAPGDEVTVARAEILQMRDAMEMRGPDSAGLFQRRNVALAHRRLAIRDIAGGRQPWISDDGQTVLVYNGEIYNDAYLRSELKSLGHRFRSRSDTEVVLAAYRQWGRECVQRFEGMFAFGIYDFRDESLLLARDRFGVKPLFLSEIDETLVFASSIPALLKHPRLTKTPNLSVISHYLTTFRITLGRQTMFTGIHQLLPGELLHWNRGKIQVEQYWNYSADEDDTLDYQEAVDQLDAGLRSSVKKRLASDVPVGMFLSGGVDSNTIACLVKGRSSPVEIAKCGGGKDDPSDDFAYARRCADHVGFDFGEVRVSADEYLETWNWMTDRYATPLSTPSDVILYHLAHEMKKSVGVVLGGEGADELLSGYAVQHWAGIDFDRSREISTDRWAGSPHAKQAFQTSLLNQYGRAQFASEIDHYFALNSLIPIAAKPALFRESIWKEAGEDTLMIDHYSRSFEELGEMPTQRKHAIQLHRLNLESLLSRLDSATMLASLEARVPYTDHLLVEQMFAVPNKFRIDVAHEERTPYLASAELESRGSIRSKRPLRTFAERLMPADLAHRKKASFPTPVQSWLSGPWKTWARETLANSPFGRSLFQPHTLDELAEHVPQAGMLLWPVLNVIQWGDRQFA